MWPNPQFPANLVTFTEEILSERLYLLCSETHSSIKHIQISSALENHRLVDDFRGNES